ncbi:MAG: tRNA (N6-isopentenyl adenosine(37)-C2)-methylthiotransferase MiaB [Elusimicrobia bacterium RIFOXYA2_FULL_39_19]|nr:MAG: tRNA (N6-isopentenyl adenosine(37)-C2)-methylthiotransferase MiaB [Elusimicrobia bacterium RIFOXYA2_FULL_39_19]
MKKYYIKTFGCQMNAADSDMFSEYLISCGYLPTDTPDNADIVIINTCSVRQHAEERAFTEIGDMKHYKAANPNGKVIVVGCMAENLGDEIKKKYQQVDLVIGAKNTQNFPEIMTQSGIIQKGIAAAVAKNDNKISSHITIMRGCNNFCSYCIVPYVRGPEQSKPVDEILKEITDLTERGIKEISLLGQNVNSYFSNNVDFADLLAKVSEIKNIKRIRFMTNHPKDVSDKLLKSISTLNKVCHHIHLPLQSGSDKILELMNRKYTFENYYQLVRKIRYYISEISITSDIMTGFPTETDKDHKATIEAINKIGFDFTYVFKYSPRSKTEAFKLKDDVTKEKKEKWHKELLDLCNSIAKERNTKLIGTLSEVLVESSADTPEINDDKKEFFGKGRDNRGIVFRSAKNLIGQSINVKITQAKIHSLIGEVEN